METLVKLMPLSKDLWIYIAIDFSLVLVLLLVLRFIQSKVAAVDVKKEMSERDNFAYGIGMSGGLLALCIVMSGVIGRHIGEGYDTAAKGILLFGFVGIILVRLGRFIHDKLVLNRIDTPDLLAQKNIAVALVDASSAVASAIILRSMILWVEGNNANAVIAIVSGFFVVLTMFILLTRIYEWRFARSNQNDSFQGVLKKGQLAVAIDHIGNVFGTAIVVTSAADILVYSPQAYVSNMTGWLIVSVALSLSLLVLVGISKHALLFGVNINKEIDMHQNVGVACVGFVLNIGFALLTVALFAQA